MHSWKLKNHLQSPQGAFVLTKVCFYHLNTHPHTSKHAVPCQVNWPCPQVLHTPVSLVSTPSLPSPHPLSPPICLGPLRAGCNRPHSPMAQEKTMSRMHGSVEKQRSAYSKDTFYAADLMDHPSAYLQPTYAFTKNCKLE